MLRLRIVWMFLILEMNFLMNYFSIHKISIQLGVYIFVAEYCKEMQRWSKENHAYFCSFIFEKVNPLNSAIFYIEHHLQFENNAISYGPSLDIQHQKYFLSYSKHQWTVSNTLLIQMGKENFRFIWNSQLFHHMNFKII